MTELHHYIQNYFGVQPSNLDQITNLFQLETLEKDTFFTKEDQYCHKLSFIQSGCLRIYKYIDGKDITQWVSSKGEFVTDLSSLIFNAPSKWNIQAMTDCSVYTISRANYNIIGTLVPQWDHLEKLFLAKCFITIEERVFSFLSMTAEERYHMMFELKTDIFNQVPLHYIASMLGMTPETLSRIRRKSIS